MRRREFISLLGGASAWPLAAQAQQPALIGLLASGAMRSSGIFVDALKLGLRDNGLLEGRDYELEVRWAEGRYGRFPAFARELIEKHPTVILATTIAAVRALQHISATVPIVMTTINDPVGAGLVASLPRPGGNTTGIANLTEDVTPKVLEILLAVLPTASAIAALFNPANPSNRLMLDKIVAHAGAVGVMVHPFELKEAEELAAAIGVLAERRPDALLVINDAAILDLRERIVAAALAHRLPTFSSFPEFTDAGALVGYGPSRLDLYRRSAYYVKKIIDGAKPADLPVEQPTRIEFSLNLKTAEVLGISIPNTILVRVDRVIE